MKYAPNFCSILALSICAILLNSNHAISDECANLFYAGKYDTAFPICKTAAEKGGDDSQFNTGYMYNMGVGVTQDYQKAMLWYKKSAEQGNVSAQYAVGNMYKSGVGVKQDYQEAIVWFNKSSYHESTSAERAAIAKQRFNFKIREAGFADHAEYAGTLKYSLRLNAIYAKYLPHKIAADMVKPDIAIQCNVERRLTDLKKSLTNIEQIITRKYPKVDIDKIWREAKSNSLKAATHQNEKQQQGESIALIELKICNGSLILYQLHLNSEEYKLSKELGLDLSRP